MSDKVVCISHHMIWHDRQGSFERNSYILAALLKKISKLSQKGGEDAIFFSKHQTNLLGQVQKQCGC